MPIIKDILAKYPNPCFIETGTHYGDTVQKALDIGFDKIISIELSNELYPKCLERFQNNPKVTLYHGDVSLLFKKIIDPINTLITFWLDAHYSGYGTARGPKDDPIMDELEIIKNHPIKTHTILIDDIRLMNRNTIINKVKEININYDLSFEDGCEPKDILVAKTNI